MPHLQPDVVQKYPASMRLVHWLRAVVVLGTLGVGLLMVNLPEDVSWNYEYLYPGHKQFGVIALILALVQLGLHRMRFTPTLPAGLPPWERVLSKLVHRSLYVLMIAVPVMGYSMSSTFTQSDGVPFLFFHLPELLPKNDTWFLFFQSVHRYLAYALLAAVALHVIGTLKHRYFEADTANDVLPRML